MNPSCSKQDIATALSVSLPTVSQHLTTLESEQLIEKCGRLSSSVGRRANAYQIISDAKIAIGLEILPHTTHILSINLYGKMIAKETPSALAPKQRNSLIRSFCCIFFQIKKSSQKLLPDQPS